MNDPFFNAGFGVAKILRHRWFIDMLQAAGWSNGESIVGAPPTTELLDLLGLMEFRQPGDALFVVVFRSDVAPEGPNDILKIIPMRVT